ncbi:major facilitator superfamily domain-containing protein [Aspergillus pseudonomiae]|uniref:Major facilitator superfamily domain-containing protein n=1 Tax=Aspergillus pseudonomiae TaxID=1506151 RepID=A0A5N7DAE6_9EURO|nr:major facilitator superfamily domain-containing protein [Aspergillus pseudonomiae]KAE8403430.1 major facilitator superfamily domain-containing protein [Aspergillus pseudonomiae]
MAPPSNSQWADAEREIEETPLLKDSKDHQSHILPRKQLLVIFPALALIHFTSFLDQTALSTSLPAIAAGLNTGSSISWVSASFLTTSTSIQLINGRLSDIFGRKTCLLGALTIMALGNLLGGWSQTPAQLYATRALSGLGAGALNALVQIAISDITTLAQRGYYFGILGVAVALGNGLGPVVGGVLTEKASWRWAFWFVCPLAVAAATYFGLVFPSSGMSDDVRTKLRRVDWFGVFTSMMAIVLILIPVSQGGTAIPWDSPIIIAMLTLGAALFGLFLIGEWRWVELPLLPMRVFKYNYSTNILLFANIVIGWVFWGNLFYIPLYFQNVRGWSPGTSGSLILPMVIAHGITSGLSGLIISWTGRYKVVISTGVGMWMLAAAAKSFYTRQTALWILELGGIFEGIGVGCSFQPVMVGLLAGSDKSDRAVVTGFRNFIRDMGGSIGVTVSGAILNNVLHNDLKGRFSDALISKITSSAFASRDLNLTDEDWELISDAYMHGLRAVFSVFAVLILLFFALILCIKDYGLAGRACVESEEHADEEIYPEYTD